MFDPSLTVKMKGRWIPKNFPPVNMIGGPLKLVSKVRSWNVFTRKRYKVKWFLREIKKYHFILLFFFTDMTTEKGSVPHGASNQYFVTAAAEVRSSRKTHLCFYLNFNSREPKVSSNINLRLNKNERRKCIKDAGSPRWLPRPFCNFGFSCYYD